MTDTAVVIPNLKPKLRTFKIRSIKPYPDNPRIITDDDVAKVQRSIEKYGYQARIIVGKDRIIIAGHTRLKALKALGWEEVEVVVVDMTAQAAREYRIIDNRSSELAIWDPTLLVPELREFRDQADLAIYFPEVDLSIDVESTDFSIDQDDLDAAQAALDEHLRDNRDLTERIVKCPKCGKHLPIST